MTDRWVAEGGSTVYVYERLSWYETFLQRATSREVNLLVLTLTLARAVWLYLQGEL